MCKKAAQQLYRFHMKKERKCIKERVTEEKKQLDKDKNRDRYANRRDRVRGETRAHSLSKMGE